VPTSSDLHLTSSPMNMVCTTCNLRRKNWIQKASRSSNVCYATLWEDRLLQETWLSKFR